MIYVINPSSYHINRNYYCRGVGDISYEKSAECPMELIKVYCEQLENQPYGNMEMSAAELDNLPCFSLLEHVEDRLAVGFIDMFGSCFYIFGKSDHGPCILGLLMRNGTFYDQKTGETTTGIYK